MNEPETTPFDDSLRQRYWIVPRNVMCGMFWMAVVLVFTGMVLLVTSKHKGELYLNWGGVMLGLGGSLLLVCLILCLHAYSVLAQANRHSEQVRRQRFEESFPDTIQNSSNGSTCQMGANLASPPRYGFNIEPTLPTRIRLRLCDDNEEGMGNRNISYCHNGTPTDELDSIGRRINDEVVKTSHPQTSHNSGHSLDGASNHKLLPVSRQKAADCEKPRGGDWRSNRNFHPIAGRVADGGVVGTADSSCESILSTGTIVQNGNTSGIRRSPGTGSELVFRTERADVSTDSNESFTLPGSVFPARNAATENTADRCSHHLFTRNSPNFNSIAADEAVWFPNVENKQSCRLKEERAKNKQWNAADAEVDETEFVFDAARNSSRLQQGQQPGREQQQQGQQQLSKHQCTETYPAETCSSNPGKERGALSVSIRDESAGRNRLFKDRSVTAAAQSADPVSTSTFKTSPCVVNSDDVSRDDFWRKSRTDSEFEDRVPEMINRGRESKAGSSATVRQIGNTRVSVAPVHYSRMRRGTVGPHRTERVTPATPSFRTPRGMEPTIADGYNSISGILNGYLQGPAVDAADSNRTEYDNVLYFHV